MKTMLQACLTGVFTLCAGAVVTAGIAQAQASSSQTTSLPSEMPEHLQQPVTDSFDYVKRDVMIPMRDGVRLHTVIVIPKGAKHAPIRLTRTPYNATGQTSHAASSRHCRSRLSRATSTTTSPSRVSLTSNRLSTIV